MSERGTGVEIKDLNNLQSAVERVKTSGALNPLLWLCGIVLPTAFVLIKFCDGWPQVFFACVSGLVILFVLAAYTYLMIKDRDRLQSEDYQLARHRIALLGDDLNKGVIVDSKPVMNQHITQIESGAPNGRP